MSVANLKFRRLRAFVLAVEAESFRVAAETLHVTQPSLSALIRELEMDLGLVLFERSGRGIKVTATGRSFYEQVFPPLTELESVYRNAKNGVAGEGSALDVATLPSLAGGIVGERVALFRTGNDRVRITLLEQKHNQIPGAVFRREVDIGIGSFLEPHPALAFTPLFDDRLSLIAPPSHPIEYRAPTWMSLDGLDFVLLTGGPTEQALFLSGVKPSHVLRVEQAPTALSMVRRGLGVTILPSTILPSCHTEGLAARVMEGGLSTRRIGLIMRKNERLSAPAQDFVSLFDDLR